MSETKVEGVRLTSPDKILYPEQGITKGDLAAYYQAIAPWMLPHVARRPVTMVRCPVGHEKKCFYQRHAGSGVLPQLPEVTVPGFEEPYLYVEDTAGLVAMVQMGTLEIHPWGVTLDVLDKPDRVIFDLDPDESLTFDDVIAAALEVQQRLADLGLTSFCKTTGGKGLHVVLPIEPVTPWPQVKAWARKLSGEMAADAPERYLLSMSKAERAGRIFIDYLRNDPTSTAVAPYSTRSRPGAPVAMPVDWAEVEPGLDPKAFTIRTAPERATRVDDPWADIGKVKQRLPV
ncbi:MAG TPA: non-homologous end-joining DNA ligase [Allosphingosinicella sp.]